VARSLRRDRITRILENRKQISVSELTERLGVSEVTIRKDLSLLEDEGLLVRTRGGAMLAEDRERNRHIRLRKEEHLQAKEAIAARAAELIEEGDTIFLDSGSTCALLAARVRDMELQVVTNSLDVVNVLSESRAVTLYCVGGSFRPDAGSFIGPTGLDALSKYRVDICFLGTTGFAEDGSLSSQNVLESQMKKQALHAAKRRVLLADRGKFGVAAFSVFGTAGEIDVVVMDADEELQERIRALGPEVLAAATRAAPKQR
jgi:DeoR/GlpR family transcriptional regulator of sugar metabolism